MKKLIASLVIAATAALVHGGYESEQIVGNGFSGHSFYASASTTCNALATNGSATAQIIGPNGSIAAATYPPYPSWSQGSLAAGNYYIYVVGQSWDAAARCWVSW